ncbi:MAG: CAP domain-containing protein [Hyphomicrobiaceae bacterium]|nr:CAP domain-containing protein [Hyphomicrobiaceae bacterium]
MRRVLVPGLLALSLSGCGLNTGGLTAGFADSGQPSSAVPPSRVALADDARPPRKADDRAPKGTYEKAPTGALADRDYSHTALDPQKARDVINAYRRQHGLKPLRLNAALTEAAKSHSRDLAKWDRISHFGSDGSNPWDRVKRAGFSAKVAAENVGTGQTSIDEVMKGWQTSPGHNKNLLLADADQMGIALVQDPKTEFKTFWTLVVGSAN